MYDTSQMEVSMPTGSLCAERSAIGSALSSDFLLRYVTTYLNGSGDGFSSLGIDEFVVCLSIHLLTLQYVCGFVCDIIQILNMKNFLLRPSLHRRRNDIKMIAVLGMPTLDNYPWDVK